MTTSTLLSGVQTQTGAVSCASHAVLKGGGKSGIQCHGGSSFRRACTNLQSCAPRSRTRVQRRSSQTTALLNEGEGFGEEPTKKKKGIKRDDEPEQYWQSEAERAGKGPMQTLLPWLAILGILMPFLILGIAFANGFIKTPNS